MRSAFLPVVTALAVGLQALVVGCTGGGDGASARVTVHKVTGKVTYLGNPLAGASVAFSPQGDQPAAVGRTNDSGVFSLMTYRAGDGAAAGDYKVVISITDSAAPSGEPAEAHGTVPGVDYSAAFSHAGKSGRGTANILPAKYGDPANTPLTAKVEPNGKNDFPFDLK